MSEEKNLQCYYIKPDGKQCENRAQDEWGGKLDCWCSEEHHRLWKTANHVELDKEYRPKPTVTQMQKRLLELGRQVGKPQGKLL